MYRYILGSFVYTTGRQMYVDESRLVTDRIRISVLAGIEGPWKFPGILWNDIRSMEMYVRGIKE